MEVRKQRKEQYFVSTADKGRGGAESAQNSAAAVRGNIRSVEHQGENSKGSIKGKKTGVIAVQRANVAKAFSDKVTAFKDYCEGYSLGDLEAWL